MVGKSQPSPIGRGLRALLVGLTYGLLIGLALGWSGAAYTYRDSVIVVPPGN